MKICVFSDSHGCAEHMIEAVLREKPALCFFLGDGVNDLVTLRSRFPSLAVNAVRGNCDHFCSEPQKLVCVAAGKRFFAAHGHAHGVKYDDALHDLLYDALRADADIVLFGHTHLPLIDRHLGMLIVNPGPVGAFRKPSYAVLTVENGEARAEIRTIETDQSIR